jgi:aspartate aminotransferase-like enzyme
MAGRNFLFVPGPSNVPDRVLRAMMVQSALANTKGAPGARADVAA